MSRTIVRRLTPLECERLQGFPDDWTLLPKKEDMSDEEFQFWQKTKEHKAMVDGKSYKPVKTKESMLKWYNKMVESDSHRYKALGNSIAIPQWYWIFRKMEDYLPENPTLGSLFDGIGGFPISFEEIYGKGSARWASEIEEFPIAVTMEGFPSK